MLKPIAAALVLAFASLASAAPQLIPAPVTPIATPGFNYKATADFDDLRRNMLEIMGSGKKRIWLLTDSLTDGELASALYIAKYRNLDVKVFLGRDKVSASGSRLPYLRGQNVATYLRPRTGFTTPTLLFVDSRLYGITRDLNSVQRLGTADIIQASPADVKAFVTWLKDVMDAPEVALPRPMRSGRVPKEPFQGDSEGSYNYDRKGGSRKAPPGVVRELPKVPKWKQTEELRKRGITAPETPADTVPAATPAPDAQGAPQPQGAALAPRSADAVLSPAPATTPAPAQPQAAPAANEAPAAPARAWEAPSPATPPAAPTPENPSKP